MSFYDRRILPLLLDFVMRQRPFTRQREKVIPRASGRVLEIGLGTGLNLAFYKPEAIEQLIGLDPAAELTGKALARAHEAGLTVKLLQLGGEQIPLDAHSVDTVTMTYTLCSIPERQRALAEMRRVLVPGGQLLFSEHGRSPDPAVRRWQQRLNRWWSPLAGGCRLDVAVPEELERAGFELHELDQSYLPGPRPMSFNYWGRAISR